MVAVERAHQESSNPPRPHASPTHAMRDAARSPGAAVGDDQRFRFSDVETASSTGAAVCSSLSSGSSAGSLPRSSSLSHLSLDCGYPSAAAAPTAAVDSTNLSRVVALPRCSSLSALSSDVAPSVRPHRSGDAAWAAIRSAASAAAPLGPKDFALVRRIGAGDIGTVYLCRLRTGASASNPPPCVHYAMKVVDRNAVAKKKKLERAAAEKRILRALDHPFLPTLFADFDAAPHFSCVVMEFCPGGDLHSLRHRLPSRRFPLPSARFYAAEVLLALEYLHMLGIVYRDLKPENVLIRADGHIMLTDFDLSLESTSSPSLVNDDDTARASCFPAHLLRFNRRRSRRQPRKKGAAAAQRFVAEPVDARSHSFVGTHEYVAPEVARGAAHGAAVDWGAYGVFLYELLYGRTPFVGADTESTLRNIAQRPLAYPRESGSGDDAKARDLIGGLLAKDPAERLGSRRGAADVKAHAFFKGINFALLRSARPPVVPAPGVRRSQSCHAAPGSMTTTTVKRSCKDARFDLF